MDYLWLSQMRMNSLFYRIWKDCARVLWKMQIEANSVGKSFDGSSGQCLSRYDRKQILSYADTQSSAERISKMAEKYAHETT